MQQQVDELAGRQATVHRLCSSTWKPTPSSIRSRVAVRLQHLTWHITFYVPAHSCRHDGCFLGKQTLLVHPLQLGYSYALGSGTTGLPLDVLELFCVLH